jgi:methylmalonyl-CoA/ethylmalonyl-CoA epimerase
MKFHHVGITVEDIDSGLQMWKEIFIDVLEQLSVKKCFDPLQEVELCLFEAGNLKIELVSGEKVKNFLRRGTKIYHICFEVDNLERKIENLINKGCILVSPPKPAVLFEGRRVAFLITPMGFLIELLEA